MASNLLNDVLNDPNTTTHAIILAFIIIIITFLIYRYISRKSQRNSVLLLGLSQSGKTVVFARLTAQRFVSTVTSMKENKSLLTLDNRKSVSLIDLPGFERLSMKYWDDYRSRAIAVMFVVDSCDLNNIRDAADLLYTYLVDEFLISKRIPVLVVCNKQDMTNAKSAKVIQRQLEREIDAIRETRSGALSSTGDDNTRAILGKIGRDFSFSDLKTPIEFTECSAAEGQHMENILKWIKRVV